MLPESDAKRNSPHCHQADVPVLHGHRSIVLFPVFHHPDGKRAADQSACRSGGPRHTATTRNIIRNLDAFQQTQIVAHYPSVTEARQAVQRGEIYSFYYIPKGTTEEALASRQPKVSFYVNYSYLIAGSLLYKDQRTMSELASAAVGQATLLAKGATEDQALASCNR